MSKPENPSTFDRVREALDKRDEGPASFAAWAAKRRNQASSRLGGGEAVTGVGVGSVGMSALGEGFDEGAALGEDLGAIGRSPQQLLQDNACDGVKGGDRGAASGHSQSPSEFSFLDAVLRCVGDPERLTSIAYSADFQALKVSYSFTASPKRDEGGAA